MSNRARLFRRAGRSLALGLLPAFLCVSLLFGGAALERHDWDAWLLGLSALLAAGCVASWPGGAPVRSLRVPAMFFLALVTLVLVQLVPLPPQIWTSLPGRAPFLDGAAFFGVAAGWHPVSLVPDKTVAALAGFLAPLGAILLVYRLGWRKSTAGLAWTIAGLGAASAALGLAQVFDGPASVLYFYDFTSRELPVGVFSNVNHQASFALMSLPFTAALAGDLLADGGRGDSAVGRAILLGAIALLQVVGVLAAGSVAGYILLVPVGLLSAGLLRRASTSERGRLPVAIVLILAVSAVAVATSPVLTGLGVTSFGNDGDMSRAGIYATTAKGLEDHWLTGAGFGTFETAFKLYEDPGVVSSTFAAQAHNDYLQIFFELGLAGLVLILALVVWWAVRFVQVWSARRDGTSRLRRAASIALLVVVLHSLVDYPLRTIGLSVLAATCLAVLIMERRSAPSPRGQASGEPAHDSLEI